MATSKPLGDIKPERSSDAESDRLFSLAELPMAAGYATALVITGFATVIASGLESAATIPNLSLVFVLPVVLAAVLFGLGPALGAAVLGTLSFNFFFTEPRWTLQIDDPANIWAMGLLFIVGCITSAITSAAQRRATEAQRHRRRAIILQACSQALISIEEPRAAMSIALDAAERLFAVPVMLVVLTNGTAETVCDRGSVELADADLEAARSSLTLKRFTPAAVYPFDGSRFDVWSAASARLAVAIGLAFAPGERPEAVGPVAETLAGLLLLALASQRAGQPSSSSVA